MIRILGRPSSSNVQKVLWCAGELGIEFSHEPEYGGAYGNTRTPEYLAMNPNALVPTLIEGDFVLWESNAIVRYLSAAFGEGGLWPTDVRARAIADKWMEWHNTTLSGAMFPAFYELVRKEPGERDQGVVDQAVAAGNRVFPILDHALAGQPYVGGDRLTMGDIAYGAAVHRWLNLPIERVPIPNVEAWYARVLEREPYKRYVALPLE